MWRRLTYEIAASTSRGGWEPVVRSTDNFSRSPDDAARGLLERWIIDYPHLLVGGERIVLADEGVPQAPDTIAATVRVTIYEADDEEADSPLAVGYLGHDRRDFTGDLPRE